ncbi:uncharacterized protein LOC134331821 [Trichomycterus rosablanca]|uniref:uncharacterized protein LOC134331821 n=1 Tax=Trichomycterus rosablanca TaxID=2290929 RepID=UPI002F350EC9
MDSLLQALRGSVFDRTEVRPVIDPQKPTNITIDMYIYGILDVDEKGQVLDMFIWLYLYWEIEGLYWDPEECGTDRVSLPRTVLWSPDIVINELYRSHTHFTKTDRYTSHTHFTVADGMDENRAPPTYFVYVNNLGEVEDEQSIHVISSCNLDIYTFPFDVQNCTYSIYSFLHRAVDVQLFFADEMKNVFQNSLSTIGTNGEWELINLIPVKPAKSPDFNPKDYWDSLVIHIILKRKSSLYVVNLLLPSCFLAALDVLSFLLPVQHVDRSAFKMTLILGYTVFLLLMNDLLPVTGNNIPLINVFFSVCLALMVVSLMETIIVTNIICNAAKYPPVPGWIRTLTYVFFSVCLALMVVSLMETIIVTNIICNAAKYPPVPGWIRTLTYVFFSVCLALMVVSLMETIIVTNIICNAAKYPPVPGWIRTLTYVFFSVCLALMVVSLMETIIVTNIICNAAKYPPVPGWIRTLTYVFFSVCLALMVVSLMETIIITNIICNAAKYPPVPGWIRTLFLRYLARLFFMGRKTDSGSTSAGGNDVGNVSSCKNPEKAPAQQEELSGSSEEPVLQELRSISSTLSLVRQQMDDQPSGGSDLEDDWIRIGLVIDRGFFIVYILFIIVSFTTILTLWLHCVEMSCGTHSAMPPSPHHAPPAVPPLVLMCESHHSGPTYESLQEVFDRKPFRPAVNLSNPTITNISFTLYAVLGVNEKTQILTTFLWLRLYWFHEFLIWDPAECDGITKISLPVNNLWTPDVIVYEFVDDDVSQACPYVYVNHTGHIRYDRMLRLVTACNLQIFSFPFDVQNCTFTFGSYMHTIRDVRVKPALPFDQMSGNSKSYLEASGEWELVVILGEAGILKFGVDEWDIITFWVVIKRRPILYVVNLLIPSSFLMIIDILSFYLPPHSVDRASFKMTLILGYTVFLLIMNDLLPSTANGTPIIGIYFSVCLALMVISLLETVVITNVVHHNSMKYRPVPGWVRIVVLKYIARSICYTAPGLHNTPHTHTVAEQQVIWSTQQSHSEIKQHTHGNGDSALSVPELEEIAECVRAMRSHLTLLQKEDLLQEEWCHVGYVLDFLLFRIYLLLITCYALVIILMWCIWMYQ